MSTAAGNAGVPAPMANKHSPAPGASVLENPAGDFYWRCNDCEDAAHHPDMTPGLFSSRTWEKLQDAFDDADAHDLQFHPNKELQVTVTPVGRACPGKAVWACCDPTCHEADRVTDAVGVEMSRERAEEMAAEHLEIYHAL